MSFLSPPKPASPEQSSIRLVLACGTVCDFHEATSAREALHLILRSLTDISHSSFNNFLMCDSASLRIGKRACPVHPDMQLQLGHLYYVLPIRTYQHRLTWSHISALAAMAMPPCAASVATPSSILPSSAAKAHVSFYNKSSPPSTISKQCVVLRTLSRIPNAKFYLHFLLRHKLVSKWKGRVDNTHTAAPHHGYHKGASAPSSGLDIEGRRAEGAVELSCMGRGRRTWKFDNICESSEMNSKYAELLIERSNSWKPPLQTIQESLAV